MVRRVVDANVPADRASVPYLHVGDRRRDLAMIGDLDLGGIDHLSQRRHRAQLEGLPSLPKRISRSSSRSARSASTSSRRGPLLHDIDECLPAGERTRALVPPRGGRRPRRPSPSVRRQPHVEARADYVIAPRRRQAASARKQARPLAPAVTASPCASSTSSICQPRSRSPKLGPHLRRISIAEPRIRAQADTARAVPQQRVACDERAVCREPEQHLVLERAVDRLDARR